MQIAITGADGFIGKNLRLRLAELGHAKVAGITRATPIETAHDRLAAADCVFHLAGVNRAQEPADFMTGNAGLTESLCTTLASARRGATVVLASSAQAVLDNPYGRSKRVAEDAVRGYGALTGAPVHIFRLNNVFGKWARPDYNSAVATFCHNIARGLPIVVNDPAAPLQLIHVDDLMDALVGCIPSLMPKEVACASSNGFAEVGPVHTTTVGEVAESLGGFADSRRSLLAPSADTALLRALYSTYVSYLPPTAFTYELPRHADSRGMFVEMLKSPDCGQFSYFTAYPGVTRGGHYHHRKTEKFLVIKGVAQFRFRHVMTGETHALITGGGDARIVESVPGWAHEITNIGDDEMMVMLWANEMFDRDRPDTIAVGDRA